MILSNLNPHAYLLAFTLGGWQCQTQVSLSREVLKPYKIYRIYSLRHVLECLSVIVEARPLIG